MSGVFAVLTNARPALVMAAFALVALVLAGGHLYYKGKADGRQEALARSVETLRERVQVDDKMRGSSNADLCAAIGGVFIDGSCQ